MIYFSALLHLRALVLIVAHECADDCGNRRKCGGTDNTRPVCLRQGDNACECQHRILEHRLENPIIHIIMVLKVDIKTKNRRVSRHGRVVEKL